VAVAIFNMIKLALEVPLKVVAAAFACSFTTAVVCLL
jgi:hypothetical protein